jgi:hypothetical protein
LEIEDEQGDVVLLCATGAESGKCRDAGKKIISKMRGWESERRDTAWARIVAIVGKKSGLRNEL